MKLTADPPFFGSRCVVPARLHQEQHGTGTPLVLAHGLAGSARNYLPQVRRQPLECRVHLYDARGHSRSEAPADERGYGWECLISDFDGVVHRALAEMPAQILRSAIVGGLSLGAATALYWTLEHRELVSGLVLAAYPESTQSTRDWASAFADCIDAQGLDAAGHRHVWGPQGRFGEQDAAMVRRGFLQHAPHAISAILRHSMAQIPELTSLAPALKELHVPILLVVGSADTTSLDASRYIASAVPKAKLAIIDNAGHVVNLSQPEPFNALVAAFAKDCATG